MDRAMTSTGLDRHYYSLGEIIGARKGLIAPFARKGPLLRVRAHVAFEVLEALEGLAAYGNGTAVHLLRQRCHGRAAGAAKGSR